jgi:hypothetical protein
VAVGTEPIGERVVHYTRDSDSDNVTSVEEGQGDLGKRGCKAGQLAFIREHHSGVSISHFEPSSVLCPYPPMSSLHLNTLSRHTTTYTVTAPPPPPPSPPPPPGTPASAGSLAMLWEKRSHVS